MLFGGAVVIRTTRRNKSVCNVHLIGTNKGLGYSRFVGTTEGLSSFIGFGRFRELYPPCTFFFDINILVTFA